MTRRGYVAGAVVALVLLPLGCGSDTTFKDHVLSRIGDPAELVRAVSCSMTDGARNWGDATPRAQRILGGLRR